MISEKNKLTFTEAIAMSKLYTIDELASLSGFSAGTIYDLTHFKILTPPIRGLYPKIYGKKGCYSAQVLDQLFRYRALKLEGLKRDEIITIMAKELVDNRAKERQCLDIAKAKENLLGD